MDGSGLMTICQRNILFYTHHFWVEMYVLSGPRFWGFLFFRGELLLAGKKPVSKDLTGIAFSPEYQRSNGTFCT